MLNNECSQKEKKIAANIRIEARMRFVTESTDKQLSESQKKGGGVTLIYHTTLLQQDKQQKEVVFEGVNH